MIIDGKHIAERILQSVSQTSSALEDSRRHILIITVAPNEATRSYLRIKEQQAEKSHMKLVVRELDKESTTEDVILAITNTPLPTIIVQLPLPAHVDTKRVLDSIPVQKDADVLSTASRTPLMRGDFSALLPPVVGAVKAILAETSVTISGKRAVVIGDGWLVGNPVSLWLKNQGAIVSNITLEFGDLTMLNDADIVVSGAGSPLLIQPHMIKEGVVLIDAGTSELNGALLGDIDPACADKASLFTPVPGGVGPIAVACLFLNVFTLFSKSH